MDELHQQQVTRSLQEIDANFNEAHAVATGLLSKVKTFSQNMKAVHESVQVTTILCQYHNPPPRQLSGTRSGNIFLMGFTELKQIQMSQLSWIRYAVSQNPWLDPHVAISQSCEKSQLSEVEMSRNDGGLSFDEQSGISTPSFKTSFAQERLSTIKGKMRASHFPLEASKISNTSMDSPPPMVALTPYAQASTPLPVMSLVSSFGSVGEGLSPFLCLFVHVRYTQNC
jgi:hypothetical protein